MVGLACEEGSGAVVGSDEGATLGSGEGAAGLGSGEGLGSTDGLGSGLGAGDTIVVAGAFGSVIGSSANAVGPVRVTRTAITTAVAIGLRIRFESRRYRRPNAQTSPKCVFDLAADFLRLINPSSQIADPAGASSSVEPSRTRLASYPPPAPAVSSCVKPKPRLLGGPPSTPPNGRRQGPFTAKSRDPCSARRFRGKTSACRGAKPPASCTPCDLHPPPVCSPT